MLFRVRTFSVFVGVCIIILRHGCRIGKPCDFKKVLVFILLHEFATKALRVSAKSFVVVRRSFCRNAMKVLSVTPKYFKMLRLNI